MLGVTHMLDQSNKLEPTVINHLQYQAYFETAKIDESKVLYDVEQFVEQVRSKAESNPNDFPILLMCHLTLFTKVYNPDLGYSARLQLFAMIRLEINRWVGFGDYSGLEYMDQPTADSIRELFYQGTDLIAQEVFNRKQKKVDRAKSLTKYMNSLMMHYQQLMVVRVDLKYRLEYRNFVDIHQFSADIEVLRYQITNHRKCFKKLKGFVSSIEQGDKDGGYHIHLLLIYAPYDYLDDCYRGKAVGMLWEEITQGQGTYFNCNDPSYKKSLIYKGLCGLGIINCEEPVAQTNVQTAAQYLVKDEQHLRVRLPGMRAFSKGSFEVQSRRGIDDALYNRHKDLRDDF